MDTLAVIRRRLGPCTCGGWACTLDSILRCRIRSLCDAHDAQITSD